jgi:hypothetical protein
MNQSNNNPTPQGNPSPNGGDPQKKKNRFNIYWIYGIVFLCLIAYNLFRSVNTGGTEISYPSQYQQMLNNGDVKSIKIISNKNSKWRGSMDIRFASYKTPNKSSCF